MTSINDDLEGVLAGFVEDQAVQIQHVGNAKSTAQAPPTGRHLEFPIQGYEFVAIGPQEADHKLVGTRVCRAADESEDEGDATVLNGEAGDGDSVEDAEDVELAGAVDGCCVSKKSEIDAHGLIELAELLRS